MGSTDKAFGTTGPPDVLTNDPNLLVQLGPQLGEHRTDPEHVAVDASLLDELILILFIIKCIHLPYGSFLYELCFSLVGWKREPRSHVTPCAVDASLLWEGSTLQGSRLEAQARGSSFWGAPTKLSVQLGPQMFLPMTQTFWYNWAPSLGSTEQIRNMWLSMQACLMNLFCWF